MRPLRLLDTNERSYDSCLPDLSSMLSIEQVPSPYTFIGDNVPAFIDPDNDYWMSENDLAASKISQFPFENNPARRVTATLGVLSASETNQYDGFNIASNPSNVSGVNLPSLLEIFKVRNTSLSTAASNDLYDITSSPNYLIGSAEPIELLQNLVSYYRPTFGAQFGDITSLPNLVPNPGAGTELLGISGSGDPGAPTRRNGSPLFPVGVDRLGRGATAFFSSTSNKNDVQLFVASDDADDHKMTSGGSDVPFTISVTFNLDNVGVGNQFLICRRRGNAIAGNRNFEYSIHVDSNGAIIFRKGRNVSNYLQAKTDDGTVIASTWYNVTVTFNPPDVDFSLASGKYKVYVNGILQSCTFTQTASQADATPSIYSRLRIGTDIDPSTGSGPPSYTHPDPDQSTEIRDGLIHSVAIWKNRVLSESEAESLYKLELVGSAVGELRHRAGKNTLGIEKAAAFRYGISNIEPEFSSVIWNPRHHGYTRDIFEPRRLIATSDGSKPIKIRFMSGSAIIIDPLNTHSQNLNTASASALPFFDDGIARNRDDNPDETLLSV